MGAYGEPLTNMDVALNKIILDSKEDGVATIPVLSVTNKSLSSKVTSFNYTVDYNGVTTTGKFTTDIDGTTRTGLTAKGCYNGVVPVGYDAALVTFYMNPDRFFGGNTDSVFVVLLNGGTNALTAADIDWKINGVSCTFIDKYSVLLTLFG